MKIFDLFFLNLRFFFFNFMNFLDAQTRRVGFYSAMELQNNQNCCLNY